VSGNAPPPASLDAFLAGVERRAFRRAQLATRDRDEALDLVQDAMLRLARSYAARPPAEWPALFQQILVNRIRDWHRSQALRRRVLFWKPAPGPDPLDEEDPLDLIADGAAPEGESALEGEQVSMLLEEAIADLPARQREVLELRVWEGLDVEQTALAMGCSEGSVKTHLSRALALLRSRLDGAGRSGGSSR
jgi:RNA polymerase sigma-70 factor (ECF subfamily)